jgi:hypothetical protein
MSEHEPDHRPYLQRPLRSLLDVSIGTALKAYALWWIGGSLIALVLALVLFGAIGGQGSDTGRAASTEVAAGGRAVTLAEYRSIRRGMPKADVQARFGRPATTNDPLQSETPPELRDDCIGYERAGGRGQLAFFCFADGKLTSKHTL